ncbi:DUF748 domain-containing protein [Mesonia maritima]|uniref:DUF748 domain-containing protein n=1 Tax=Mesonia maritima TaxID=1793873 RepID=A0ABU1K5P3_9FLAO|nr:DUF748 domain-containing protein [Mesonia maritima]MDR6300565.1 hypothetical protein [Mesonia maritima]
MTSKEKRKFYRKKRYQIIFIIVILLIAFRIYLPTLVKNYVNDVLADIPGYYGQVDDIDIALIRGAYVINGLYLDKVNAETKTPFLNFPKTDISVEWKSLFQGKIVSEIEMSKPQVTYVFEDQQKTSESGEADTEDWTKALTDLVPLEINHFEVHNGTLAFVQLQANPNIDLNIHNLNLVATNLRNVKQNERKLPSSISASGVSIGEGNVKLEGRLNLIKEIPDMDISFSLENAQATAFNSFTNFYAGLDFEEGSVGVFSEVAIADGYMKGYVKPLLTDTKLIGKEDGFVETLWEGFVGLFKFILKNQGTDTVATKVPFEGDLNNVKTGVFPTVFNVFKNAWIKAFLGQTDEEINYKDAFNEQKNDGKKKSENKKSKKK